MASYPAQSRNSAFSEGMNGGPAVQQADPMFHPTGPLMIGNQYHSQNGMGSGTYGYKEPYDEMMIQRQKSSGGSSKNGY